MHTLKKIDGEVATTQSTLMARREISRLSLAVPTETRERLERLQAVTGAATMTDTISNALRVFEWLTEQRLRGREVLVREPGGQSSVVEFVF